MVDQEDVSDYASRSGDCFITDQIQYNTLNGTETRINSTITVNCDCSDPENYKFKDKVLCEILKLQSTLIADYNNDAGFEKMTALTCGSLVNFLSVGLMIFCTLLIL